MEYIRCLKSLSETAEYQIVIKHLVEQRPKPPIYNYKEDNTEAWKALSLMQQGFDLALSHLRMRITDDE